MTVLQSRNILKTTKIISDSKMSRKPFHQYRSVIDQSDLSGFLRQTQLLMLGKSGFIAAS